MKKPNAVPTASVPVLRLKCYHVCVHTSGSSPYDAVKGHYGLNSFELVDPSEGAPQLQTWLNEEETDGGPTLRHLEIEDRHGVHRYIAQRRGSVAVFTKDSIIFDSFSDYDSVLPNPGVTDDLTEEQSLQSA